MLIPEKWFLPLILILGPVVIACFALAGLIVVKIRERRAIRRRLGLDRQPGEHTDTRNMRTP